MPQFQLLATRLAVNRSRPSWASSASQVRADAHRRRISYKVYDDFPAFLYARRSGFDGRGLPDHYFSLYCHYRAIIHAVAAARARQLRHHY